MHAEQLAACAAGARKYAGRSLTSLIGMGLYFLKAHHITASARGRGGKAGKANCATVAQFGDAAAPEGFDQWLQETFQEAPFAVSRRTAYNYIRAALRVGLTHESTEGDVEALESSNALAGKSARQLYMPENSSPENEPEKRPKGMTQGDLFLGWEMQMDNMLTPESEYHRALPLLPVQKLDEMERKLRTALDLVKEAKTAALKGAGKGTK